MTKNVFFCKRQAFDRNFYRLGGYLELAFRIDDNPSLHD